jgi:hypothetical protein
LREPISKIPNTLTKKGLVEWLKWPNECEALSSNPSTAPFPPKKRTSNICSSKHTITGMKRGHLVTGNTYNFLSSEVLVTMIRVNVYGKKKKEGVKTNRNWTKGLNRHFTKENI